VPVKTSVSTESNKARSLADALFRRLHGQILSGEFAAGSRLPAQKYIAEREKVSRTVVREAVARLAANGLAVPRQGAGVFVSQTPHYRAFQIGPEALAGLEDVLKLLELRLAVESEMARLAALRRTYEHVASLRLSLEAMDSSGNMDESVEADAAFHATIASATGNEHFERFVEFLGVRLVPPRSLFLNSQPAESHKDYARKIAQEHRAIFDAIVDQDPERARAAARRHMQDSLERHAQLGRGLSRRS
jgi:DNA-binding FadR family transcriptional regulator